MKRAAQKCCLSHAVSVCIHSFSIHAQVPTHIAGDSGSPIGMPCVWCSSRPSTLTIALWSEKSAMSQSTSKGIQTSPLRVFHAHDFALLRLGTAIPVRPSCFSSATMSRSASAISPLGQLGYA